MTAIKKNYVGIQMSFYILFFPKQQKIIPPIDYKNEHNDERCNLLFDKKSQYDATLQQRPSAFCNNIDLIIH